MFSKSKKHFQLKKLNKDKHKSKSRIFHYKNPISLLFKIKPCIDIKFTNSYFKSFPLRNNNRFNLFLFLFYRSKLFFNKNIQFLIYYCFTFFFINLCRRRCITDDSLRARLFFLFNTLLNGTYNLVYKHFYLTGPFWLSLGFSVINISRFSFHYRFIISILYLFLGRFIRVSTIISLIKSINFFTLKKKFFNLKKIYYYLIPGLSQFRKLTKQQNLYVKKLRLFLLCASKRKETFFRFFPIKKVSFLLKVVSQAVSNSIYSFVSDATNIPILSSNILLFYRKCFIHCLNRVFKDSLYKLRSNIPFYKTASKAFSFFVKKVRSDGKFKTNHKSVGSFKTAPSVFVKSSSKNPRANFGVRSRFVSDSNVIKKKTLFFSRKEKFYYKSNIPISSDFYKIFYKNSVFFKLPLKIPYVIRDRKLYLLKLFSASSNKFSKLIYPVFLYKQKFPSLKKIFGKKIVKKATKKGIKNVLYLKKNYKLFVFLRDKFFLFCRLNDFFFKNVDEPILELKNKKGFVSFLHSFLLRNFFKKTLYRFVGVFGFIFKVIYKLYLYRSFFRHKVFVLANFLHENFYFSNKPYVKTSVLVRPTLINKRGYIQSLKRKVSNRSFLMNKKRSFLFSNNFFLDDSGIIYNQPILTDFYRLGYKLHINNTIGNVFLNFINLKNRTVKFTSSGILGFKQKKKRLPLALETAGKEIGTFFGSRIRKISVKNVFLISSSQIPRLNLYNILKGFFFGYQESTKDINLNFFQPKKQFPSRNGFKFFLFIGKKIAHNGCRPKKARRV